MLLIEAISRMGCFSMGNNKSTVSFVYIISVTLCSFILAVFLFWSSSLLAEKVQNLALSIVFLIIVIMVGIVADVIGVSVTAASEVPLHAKAAKKIPGATEGISLIRNADRVANLMNDVVGDIAGTLSGAMGIALVLQLLLYWNGTSQLILNMLFTAAIASLTVGGKAAGKRIALTHANEIVHITGRFLHSISLIRRKGFYLLSRKSSR